MCSKWWIAELVLKGISIISTAESQWVSMSRDSQECKLFPTGGIGKYSHNTLSWDIWSWPKPTWWEKMNLPFLGDCHSIMLSLHIILFFSEEFVMNQSYLISWRREMDPPYQPPGLPHSNLNTSVSRWPAYLPISLALHKEIKFPLGLRRDGYQSMQNFRS